MPNQDHMWLLDLAMTSGCSSDKLHCLQSGGRCQAQAQSCTQTGACVCSSAAELDELQYEPVKVATLKERDRLAALHHQLFGQQWAEEDRPRQSNTNIHVQTP